MGYLLFALILATFLCSLVAGFLLAFALVVMPGMKQLENKAFIRAFQAIDGIIQDGQPVFTALWVGSAIALVVAAAFSLGEGDAVGGWLIILATLGYLLGVQLPTVAINIPLNNRLQSVDVEAVDETAQAAAREAFEGRWNRWNAIRTVVACGVSLLLIVAMLRY